jgi:multidrug efflux pump subunit AcrA (membrane-fusion protein)
MKWLNLLAIIPIIIGILIFKGAVSGRKPPEKKAEPEATVLVETEPVEARALPRLLSGFGSVVAERRWTAVPQISGKVTNVHPNLKTGGFISKDQVLFVIETVDQGLEQDLILAERRALQAEIAQVGQRKIRLEQSLEAARSTLALLQREEDRYQNLFEQGATPASTVDAQKRAVLTQQRIITDIESNISTLPAQVDAVNARISGTQANLQKQSVQIGRAIVRAPFHGRLGEVYLEKGQVVSAGSQLFSMQGSDQVRVEARFPQAQLGEFPLTGARVTTPSGQVLKARVGPLRENVDPVSRTASVQLTVDAGSDGALLPGALVQVTLEGQPHDPYPVIPRSALHNRQVFLVVDGKLARREIEIAFREGDLIAVKRGLEQGESLVVSDPGLAMDGSLVQVMTKER